MLLVYYAPYTEKYLKLYSIDNDDDDNECGDNDDDDDDNDDNDFILTLH